MQTPTLQQTRDKISFFFFFHFFLFFLEKNGKINCKEIKYLVFFFFFLFGGGKKWKNPLQRDIMSLKLIRTAQQRHEKRVP
jgi:hypothetical protein